MEATVSSSDSGNLTRYMAHCLTMASVAFLLRSLILGGNNPAPYGRYSVTNARQTWMMSPTIGWLVQESPSFLFPCLYVFFGRCPTAPINIMVLIPFMLHYFFRSFIYPFQLLNGKPTPWYIVTSAFIFCCFNGFLQGCHSICIASYSDDYYMRTNFIIGIILFIFGWGVNIHSDFTLKNLRKPGETGYKIPKGGFFEVVSCANYFGEILEWWGYALSSWTYPAFAFAIWSSIFLVLRANDHHKYYLQHVKGYPRSRKVVIPYLL